MQSKNTLEMLLQAGIKTRSRLLADHRPPLFLKLAPDLNAEERKDIVKVIQKDKCEVDGLIICNTTIERPDSLKSSSYKEEGGGLSGQPLQDVSTQMIADMYRLTQGKIPIIGKNSALLKNYLHYFVFDYLNLLEQTADRNMFTTLCHLFRGFLLK